LASIFVRDANGKRAVFGNNDVFQSDPHWRDYLLFYEYFNGDNGSGVGASHQTGWTGTVARLIQFFAARRAEEPEPAAKAAAAAARTTMESIA
jgi:hypothetical protein